jgi:hypothetical protein
MKENFIHYCYLEQFPMTRYLVLFLICFYSSRVQAQTVSSDSLTLSAAPTAAELVNAFALAGQGRIEPFELIQTVIQRGEDAVPALDAILAAQNPPDTSLITNALHSIALYSVQALEAIGGQSAFASLCRVATTHRSLDVRGSALNALANAFPSEDSAHLVTPDTDLVHMFLRNVDDTTMVISVQKSLGQIARDGLLNWTGWNFGEPQGKDKLVHIDELQSEVPLSTCRELWWESNGASVRWDAEKGRFTLQ